MEPECTQEARNQESRKTIKLENEETRKHERSKTGKQEYKKTKKTRQGKQETNTAIKPETKKTEKQEGPNEAIMYPGSMNTEKLANGKAKKQGNTKT
jgi:hypothetical protein